MEINKQNIALSLFGALVVATVVFLFSASYATKVGASPATASHIGVATTSTSVSVAASTRILATTTNALGNGTSYTRVYATICNPNANAVYVLLDGDKPASLSKANVVLSAAAGYNVCYEITDRNLYQGSITASSTNQTATSVIVTDYVQ